MKQSVLWRAVRQFLETTTLHGFKYLCSPYNFDRVCWLLWCWVSACCGGALCGVLWARYLHTPALLVALSPLTARLAQPVPLVAVCAAPARIANAMVEHLSLNSTTTKWLPFILGRILQGLSGRQDQLDLLDNLLTTHNLTLPEVLANYTPPCEQLTSKCRWQNVLVDCKELFSKENGQWGFCCVTRLHQLKEPGSQQMRRLKINQRIHRLVLALQCNNGSRIFGCEFFTLYRSEETTNPAHLEPGYIYTAQLTFRSVQDGNTEQIVDLPCESNPLYSRQHCWDKCTEHKCGCLDPLRHVQELETELPPPCPASRINCLAKFESKECNCPPTCKKINSEILMEASPLKEGTSFDPIYAGLNATTAIVLNFQVRLDGSKIYKRMPTETWLTLLSSLGGVFNMFLGVGLFSALEFIFLLLVRLPAAVRRSTEITPVTEFDNNKYYRVYKR